MLLNDRQMQSVRRFFRLNGVVPDCPYCSTHGWNDGEIIATMVVDEQGNARPDAAAVPMVQFVCDNCGHVSLFDARRLGLFGDRERVLRRETV